jgi:hypothetical protein
MEMSLLGGYFGIFEINDFLKNEKNAKHIRETKINIYCYRCISSGQKMLVQKKRADLLSVCSRKIKKTSVLKIV